MRKALALLLCLILIVVPVMSVPAFAEPEDPGYTADADSTTFTVYTPAGLNAVASLINAPETNATYQSYTIVLAADLDFEAAFGGERNWTPIGYTSADQKTYYPFFGTFDGAGHTIKGLYTVATVGGKRFQGLIGVGIGCTIKNVTVADSVFEGLEFVAAILGVDDGGDVVIQNCHVLNCTIKAPVSNGNNVGGIVGRFRGGQTATGIKGFKVKSVLIEDCTVLADMESFRNIGGICGGEAVGATDVWTATFRNCVTAGTYTYYHKSTDGASGIFAYNAGNSSDSAAAAMTINFENCVSVANIVNAAEGGNKIYGSICHLIRDGAYTMTNCIGMGAYSATLTSMKAAVHTLTIDNCAIYDPAATGVGEASFWVNADTIDESKAVAGTATIDGEASTFKGATLPVITTAQMVERIETMYTDAAFRARALAIVNAKVHEIKLIGVQQTKVENDKVSVRVIGGLYALDFEKVTFNVQVNSGETSANVAKDTTSAYTSINATDVNGDQIVLTAADLDAAYLTALRLINIPATGTYTFTVSITATIDAENSSFAEAISFTVTDGVLEVQ